MDFAGDAVSQGVKKLFDIPIKGLKEVVQVKENLAMLFLTSQRIQEKLEKLDRLLISVEIWKPLALELSKLCYMADDIVDGMKLAELRRQSLNRQGHSRQINNDSSLVISGARNIILSKLKRWGLPHKICSLLEKLRKREQYLDDLINNNSHGTQQQTNNSPHHIPTVEPLFLGRQTDQHNIVQLLILGGSSGVSIVGMYGLGKTTLARSILDDASIVDHFNIFLWGGPLNHFKLSKIRRVTSDGNQPFKKTLLVLDDLQATVSLDTLALEDAFRSLELQPESLHITFLITTRDPRVARCNNTVPYYLKRMSDEDTTELIKLDSRVYPSLNSEAERKVFDKRAHDIAQKCMGLPIVASFMANAVYARSTRPGIAPIEAISYFTTEQYWGSAASLILEAFRNDLCHRFSRRNPILSSPCKFLAYFSLFPHGHSFQKDGLLQLWMAEGFIQPEKWTGDWEVAANQHFDEILPASMIEPSSNIDANQDPSTYQILEITRLYAQSIVSNMCCSIDNGDSSSVSGDSPRHITHMSLCSQNIEKHLFLNIARYFQELRTFLFVHKDGNNINSLPSCLFQKLLVLRVLDLSRSTIKTVPYSIGNLEHLRYLDFSYTSITNLPDSTCKLFGLRILKLIECSQLQHLPKRFSKLVNLIQLDLNQTSLCSTPPKMGKLVNLQNLQKFTVKKIKGHHITELMNMKALRGSLKIAQLENVQDESEARKASLSAKSYLTSLELQWTESSMLELPNATRILEMLRPSKDLVELKVTNYNGRQYPQWFDSPQIKHNNLQKIYLHNWPNCERLPPFWKLPILRILRLDSIDKIEELDRNFFGIENETRFPVLECLEFCNMTKLGRWCELVNGDMPCLRIMKITGCPSLNTMPSLNNLTSLKLLEISLCNQLDENFKRPDGCECYITN